MSDDFDVKVRQIEGRAAFTVTFDVMYRRDLTDKERTKQMLSKISYNVFHKIRDLQKEAGLEVMSLDDWRAGKGGYIG